MDSKKNTVAGLFSGCGGLDLGFIQAGFEVVWANDFFKEAVETYKKNIGKHIVLGDITKIPSSDIPNDFDILLGGFPCQGFSIANIKRSMKDKRNFLYLEMLKLSKINNQNILLLKMLNILSLQKGQVIEMIIRDFERIGYKVDYKLMKASEYGVPQNRERVIIIGNRLGIKNPFPQQTHGEKDELLPFVSTKEAVGFLSDVRIRDKSFLLNGQKIINHKARVNVHDKFWGRKHNVNQHEVCDYLKLWRNKSGWSTKKIDEHLVIAYHRTLV